VKRKNVLIVMADNLVYIYIYACFASIIHFAGGECETKKCVTCHG
jgi:hypothetical protein